MKASVIVLTYNANPEKLKMTLKSVIGQKCDDFEIIIADDGSKTRWDDETERFFHEYGFEKYKFANSSENVGTVLNIINAVNNSRGKYVKLLSPGDTFYDSDVLSRWIAGAEEKNSQVSFGRAVYYMQTQEGATICRIKNSPANISIYSKGIYNRVFVNCLLANDGLVGATILYRRDVLEKYLGMIAGKVKYAEDYMLRLMIYDGIKVDFYDKNVIWYEYGGGISTNKNNKWAVILHKDFDAANDIIRTECEAKKAINRRYRKYLNLSGGNDRLRKLRKITMFPSMIICRLRARLMPEITPEGDIRLLKEFMDN